MHITKNPETEEVRNSASEFLQNHKKMILTILDENKHPNSSLMLYAADDFTLYFGTRRSFGKYHALKADPHVAAAIVQESIDPLQVLDIQGIAKEVAESETEKTLSWFLTKNDATFYIKDAPDLVMFKIQPTCVRWLNALSGDLQVCDIGV